MLRRFKFWRIAAISLSCEIFGLAPALAGNCGLYGCGAVVQQTGGYVAVFAPYCDGYGGGQWPYASCSVGRIDNGHPMPAPALAVAKAPAPRPGPPPIVTKYRADAH